MRLHVKLSTLNRKQVFAAVDGELRRRYRHSALKGHAETSLERPAEIEGARGRAYSTNTGGAAPGYPAPQILSPTHLHPDSLTLSLTHTHWGEGPCVQHHHHRDHCCKSLPAWFSLSILVAGRGGEEGVEGCQYKGSGREGGGGRQRKRERERERDTERDRG